MRSFVPIGVAFIIILTVSCSSNEQKEELLAKQYCAACHAFPEPSRLDKKAWSNVMPQMALRMGVDMSQLSMISEEDYPYVIQTLPRNPMLTVEEFDAIKNYYQREAPDSLSLPEDFVTKDLTQFEVTPHRLWKQRPAVTMLRADTVNKRIWMSTRKSGLYRYDFNFNRIDSTQLTSPASSIVFDGGDPTMTLMGIMDPNDQPAGTIGTMNEDLSFNQLIDSIKRPVHIEKADFNNDKLEDIVVCAFGNYGGALLVYERRSDGKYNRHVISGLPGARKVVVRDFNDDGLPDILALFAQGDEQISLYTNAGSFRFRVNTLLRFSSVDGSSYFDITDFNKDGHWDIVYSNGDNADYSIILKPYHGVRIFLNDGKNQFTESWFHRLHGCSIALARDFDKDGDVDIATISFFPEFKKTPERAFVYFENNGGNLEPYTTPLGADGRWLLMEPADIDQDGYTDILLGALDFDNGVPPEARQRWSDNPVDVLVLKNKGKK
ncbi:MAG TPA: FG-GAP-like repeat-containing protein [Cyclobacteriaceae bacterium]|nr:FG-GAP-like repeat-containing protein [Cyclobacteriaceae bacterium]